MRLKPTQRDQGLTLVELIITTTLIGLVVAVVSAALVTAIKVSPATQYRIDDARSVRALQTWLIRDAASTPSRQMSSMSDLESGGGFVFSGQSIGWMTTEEQCGANASNILHMAWTDASSSVRYHANYRLSGGRIIRSYCSTSGASSSQTLAGDVSTGFCLSPGFASAYSYRTPATGPKVTSVEICVRSQDVDNGLNTGVRGASDIVLSVSSRNLTG